MRSAEDGRKIFGAVLSLPEPKKLLDGTAIPAAAAKHLGDDLLAKGWELAHELAARGDKVNAMTVFALGLARNKFNEDDLPVLQALESRNTIDAATFMQVAKQFRTRVHGQALCTALVELVKLLQAGTDPGPTQARFEAIQRSYHRLHAAGLRGSEVLELEMQKFDQRKGDGKELYIKLGLPKIDEVTGGAPPKYCMFLGPPSAMKSGAMATCLEQRVEHHGARPLVISLEDGRGWPFKRLLARKLGMPLRDVFNKEFQDGARASEELAKLSTQFFDSWFLGKENVQTPDEIVAECWRHVAQHGITEVWLDNARHVKHVMGKFEQPRQAIGRMHEAFADFCERSGLPLFLMIHTSRAYEDETEGKKPPSLSHIQESSAAEADVRFLLGFWEKNECTRATVLKHTEGKRHDTVEFDRIKEAALLDPDSGRIVNLQEEERKDAEEAQSRNDSVQVSRSFRRKKLARELIAANPELAPPPKPVKAKKAEAQAALALDVSPPAKPEEPKP
jgi:replicative DNA helicase